MSGPGPREPSFTIVVPTRDRPERLRHCLAGIARLRYPRERLEVVVVDDGSRGFREGPLREAAADVHLRFRHQDGLGPARARNLAASVAEGEFLAFLDDDCVPDPDWLEAFAGRLDGRMDLGLGGRTVNRLPDNLCASASQALIDYLYETFNVPGRVPLFTSNNLVLPLQAFRSTGGFDESFLRAGGEDRELCYRWVRSGFALEHEPGAIVGHYHDLDLRDFIGQHFRYGRGARLYRHLRPSEDPVAVEPLSFYRDLLLDPYRRRASHRPALVGLMFVSQAANAAGYAWERIRELAYGARRRASRL